MIQQATAATLEMLTSPWIVIKYEETKGKLATNFVIFCRSKFGSTLEFLYLIDYLMHYQMLVGENSVQIKCLNADSNAIAYFNKAKDQYIDVCQETQKNKKNVDTSNLQSY